MAIKLRAALAAGATLALLGGAGWAQDAAAIHQRALVLDSHVDVLLPSTNERYRAEGGGDHADLAKLKAGGVDAVVLAVAVSTGERTPEGYAAARQEADEKLTAIQAFAAGHPGEVRLARSADEVEAAAKAGEVAVLIGFLNAYSLGKDLSAFDHFYAGGVRVAGLAHAGDTVFADSSRPRGDEGEEHGGLSALGKQAVARFNDLGVLIDVSQLTPKGVLQTIELSRAPVVATHSNARALVEATRNLSDAELDAIKRNGGVVQVTPFNAYLVQRPADYDQQLAALRAEYGLSPGAGYGGADDLPAARRDAFFLRYRALVPQAGVKELVDHIDYIARRIGVDHVGFGSDFNHGAGIEGFADESQAANLTWELVARGYSEADIDKIWGGNFLRVLRAAEAARNPQTSNLTASQ